MPTHTLRRNKRFCLEEYAGRGKTDVTENLVSKWLGNYTSADAVGTNHATSDGGISYGDGLTLGCFVGSGSSTSWLYTTNAISSPSTYSWSAWIKTTSAIGFPIIMYDSNQTTFGGNYDRMLGLTSAGYVYWGVFVGGERVVQTSTPLNDGTWHHIVVTTTSGISRIWVDGNFITSMVYGGGAAYSGYWKLGICHIWGSIPSAATYFTGNMQDIRYYSAILTDFQIQTLFFNQPMI